MQKGCCAINNEQTLLKVLADLCEHQNKHSAFLLAGNLKTVSEWATTRQQLDGRLRACLDSFDFASIAQDSTLAVTIRKSLKNISKEDEALACLIKDRQGFIRKQLQAMRKGKKMLNGYGSSLGAEPKPKFLSSRT